jgi:beta-fructofuranosidase
VFRDPYVFRDADRWWMLVGAGLVDGTAAVLGYVSDDLERWSYEGLVASRPSADTDPEWTGSAWECPQLFALDDRWVLLVSVWHDHALQYVAYATGTWSNGRFDPGTWRRLTWGDAYYAPTAFVDRAGQKGLLHWLRGVDDLDGGWAGALSVPHGLQLDGDVLQVQPHPEVDRLRRPLGPDVSNGPTDVLWRAGSAPLRLHRGDGRVVVELVLAGDGLRLHVDGQVAEREVPCSGGQVRVLTDGPVVEVFTGSAVLAARVPAGTGALRPLDQLDGSVTCWSLGGPPAGAG